MRAWAYAAAVVAFTLVAGMLALAAGGGRIATAKPAAHVTLPEPSKERVCTALRDDGTIQGACDRWEWK